MMGCGIKRSDLRLELNFTCGKGHARRVVQSYGKNSYGQGLVSIKEGSYDYAWRSVCSAVATLTVDKIVYQCLLGRWVSVDYDNAASHHADPQCGVENVNTFKQGGVPGSSKVI